MLWSRGVFASADTPQIPGYEIQEVNMQTTITATTGLFSQLEPLLVHRAVLITVSKLEDGGVLQVNICPRRLKEGENPALTVPLCVTGTAAELDAELLTQITSFVEAHIRLNSNLTAIEKEMAEAEKAAREQAKKKSKAVSDTAKKTAETNTKTAPVPAKTEAQQPPMLSLFDQQPVASTVTSGEATQPAAKDPK